MPDTLETKMFVKCLMRVPRGSRGSTLEKEKKILKVNSWACAHDRPIPLSRDFIGGDGDQSPTSDPQERTEQGLKALFGLRLLLWVD